MQHASLGSISHGTLRNADLLDTFATELEYHVNRNAEHWIANTAERDRLMKLIGDARETDPDSEDASETVNTLIDELGAFAPPYAYFGAHQGDGSDFGYWPDHDAIEELPRVNDPADVEGMDEDCMYVNDHGNVTIYAADGSVIWDCV